MTAVIRNSLAKARRSYKWTAPTPNMETVADVRRCSACCFCKKLGTDLLYIDRAQGAPLRRLRKHRGRTAHAYCYAKKNEGEAALSGLHVEELDKVRLCDLRGLGIDMIRLDFIVGEAKRRTKAVAK